MSTENKEDTGSYVSPAINLPTLDQLKTISKDLGFQLTDEELLQHREHMKGAQKAYQRVSELVEPTLEVKYPRTPGHRPKNDKNDNPNNAWAWRTDIQGAKEGKLYGRTVAIKDSIAVAGVPMSNGGKIFQGYVPEFDATCVTRVLDAGGRITGKSQCEDMTFSANSFTSPFPVTNPADPTRSSGGSCSGSGALLANGQVDLAVGADTAGSIRVPASWCGIVGFKPTYGLVPCSGACFLDPTLDHIGPMARTVDDCALLLEVLVGYDGFDSTTLSDRPVQEYSRLVTKGVAGLKVGFLKEGFEGCESDVEQVVKTTADMLRNAGATVEDISLPMHKDAMPLFHALTEGIYIQSFYGGSMGKSFYPNSITDHYRKAIKTRPFDLPITRQANALWGEFTKRFYDGKFYGKAQNLCKALTDEYNRALEKVDVLIMPTCNYKAPKLPESSIGIDELLSEGISMVKNTVAANITGHPAISINVGYSEGLPVGALITGRHHEDAIVLRVAKSLESGLRSS
ncbi:unnamed protein product [Owenia fusiformis]|uniref:Amidase domain-containing protein n=1 Tax=Owenia fusiformis TaxID=6347 RepID=A0A8S4Q480_OWEFU|nr:unnamed protein product [Owenia fusiformis]